jgi:antitoxin (DNA-binding transcriptional repressor) of toxin-antitoxin stability system
MSTISLHEFEHDPMALLSRVEAGESLQIVRSGHAIVELRPVVPTQNGPRPFGLCAGQFTVPDDFDSPLPDDLLREFDGQ